MSIKRSIDNSNDNIDNKKIKLDNVTIWQNNLTKLKEYIDTNYKLPSTRNKYKDIRALGKWYHDQKLKYKNNYHIMKNKEIKKQWEDFMTEYYEKIKLNVQWERNLNNVKEYINTFGKIPSRNNTTEQYRKLGKWLDNQKQRINMKDDNIKQLWDEFNKEYLIPNSNNDWHENLEKLKNYINENKETPSQCDEIYEIRVLSLWLNRQRQYYKNNTMKDEYKEKWSVFVQDYGHYMLSNEDEWYIKLDILKKYINKYKQKPIAKVNHLGNWLYLQQQYYKTYRYGMKNENIRTKWDEFMNEYKIYILPEEIWLNNLLRLKNFIDINKEFPNKNNDEYLYKWYNKENKNYRNKRMKDDQKTHWEQFIKDYNIYSLTRDGQWYKYLDQVINYIKENNSHPSPYNKNKNIRNLGKWLTRQHENHRNNKYLMRNTIIKNIWEDFVKNNYSSDQWWKNALSNLINYINTYKKIPTSDNKNKHVRGLCIWTNAQYNNYINNKSNMTKPEFRQLWEKFLLDHQHIIVFTQN